MPLRSRIVPVLLSWVLTLLICDLGVAATVTAGFTDTLIASGLSRPTAMALAPDGRVFVCEQGGTLRVVKNGTLLTTPFVSVTVSSVGERGLLGVAFDLNFATNGFVYVYYTALTPTIHNRVSRFTAAGDVATAGSETIILELETLSATNHNGGAIHFGPDGKLYVAVGENAVGSNAQSLNNRLGKMLRINADGSIPSDNPFFTTALGANRAIWALGLRNPFTFAFQPLSQNLFINDVGQNAWEEINLGVAGANYGWPTTEGETSDPAFRSPIYAYGHSDGCAIAGGAFHYPLTSQFPFRSGARTFLPISVADGFGRGNQTAPSLTSHPESHRRWTSTSQQTAACITSRGGLVPRLDTYRASRTLSPHHRSTSQPMEATGPRWSPLRIRSRSTSHSPWGAAAR